MRFNQGIVLLVLLISLPGLGCHTMRFEIASGSPVEVVRERKTFFFWGLAPTREVDVMEHCPGGALAVVEDTTFGDVMLAVITLGIYSPRSSWFECARLGGGS